MINEKNFGIINIGNLYNDSFVDEIKIAYLKKDDVPEIEIKNKNTMIYDGKECKISDYIEQINENIKKVEDINDNSNDLIDDYYYDRCGICKNNLNKYFCVNCHKNICEDCYKKCNEGHHKTLILEEMESKQ